MSEFKVLIEAVTKGDIIKAVAETQKAIDAGGFIQAIIDEGLIAAMDEVGDNFSKGTIFVPQMLRSAKTMQECMKLLEPLLKEGDTSSKGKVIIGTVKGDLHDIGKNLVIMMLEGQGFSVVDLGISVNTDKFVETVIEKKPDIVALSALLTTTMMEMKNTIVALEEAGLRNSVKIIVGGAPVTRAFADQIGADGYGYDAPGAAQKCKELVLGKI